MTTATELTDDGLIRKILGGDEDAFTVLYRRRQPALFRFALHMSGNAAVAEDVTQEVFMTLIRDAKKFDPTRGTVAGFLFGVARNHLRKRWEQDRRLVTLLAGAEEEGGLDSLDQGLGETHGGNGFPEDVNGAGHGSSIGKGNGNGRAHDFGAIPTSRDQFATYETVGRVRQAIASLPENYREVVVLCELEELSYEEAATALGCPLGTVRSRLHRARAVLLEKLRDAQPVRRASAVGR